MALDRSDVEKIAHLARLQIADQDVQEYAENLTSILDLVDQMQAVDHDMMRENAHSTMTITKPDRQSRVTFGGPKR